MDLPAATRPSESITRHDLFVEESLGFIDENKDGPFFLYLPLTIPHANNEATRMTGDGARCPTTGFTRIVIGPDQDKGQAAMITRMDGDVGRILDHLARDRDRRKHARLLHQ